MRVSIGIIALNEENNITDLFESILCQTYPKKMTEIVMVDSCSTDKTKFLMQEFKNNNIDNYFSIKILDNLKKNQASGWNEVIRNFTGDVLVRIDAHAVLTPNFIEKNVECIESGEYVCGGQRINIIKGKEKSKQVLLAAENSMFGSGIASYRRKSEKKYVSTVAHACYRREIFDKVGFFDERLLRSEDNDMHYRIRTIGYKICRNNEIKSYYQTRPNLKEMIKQKYKNGEWIGITSLLKTYKMFSLYHFVPCFFVLVALFALTLFIISIIKRGVFLWLSLFFIVGVLLYFFIDLALSIKSAKEYKVFSRIIELMIIFPILHFSYGSGTIIGFIKGMLKVYK